MKKTDRNFKRVFVFAGSVLILAAVLLPIFWQFKINASVEKTKETVTVIKSLIPEPESAFLEERTDNTMSVLSVGGKDFSGIIEIPRYGSVLPVCDSWGKVFESPCRLSGSIYNGTLQVGGTSQKGQYDFYREISAGDSVFFTDMEGNRFSFEVTDIRYEKHADQAALNRKDASLVLFIKNIYAFEYIVVFCSPIG